MLKKIASSASSAKSVSIRGEIGIRGALGKCLFQTVFGTAKKWKWIKWKKKHIGPFPPVKEINDSWFFCLFLDKGKFQPEKNAWFLTQNHSNKITEKTLLKNASSMHALYRYKFQKGKASLKWLYVKNRDEFVRKFRFKISKRWWQRDKKLYKNSFTTKTRQ